MSEERLDATGLLCPLPVIRTQDQVEGMDVGDILHVTCTDPGVLHDIPAWCRINGHRIIAIDDEADEIVISIEVGRRSA